MSGNPMWTEGNNALGSGSSVTLESYDLESDSIYIVSSIESSDSSGVTDESLQQSSPPRFALACQAATLPVALPVEPVALPVKAVALPVQPEVSAKKVSPRRAAAAAQPTPPGQRVKRFAISSQSAARDTRYPFHDSPFLAQHFRSNFYPIFTVSTNGVFVANLFRINCPAIRNSESGRCGILFYARIGNPPSEMSEKMYPIIVDEIRRFVGNNLGQCFNDSWCCFHRKIYIKMLKNFNSYEFGFNLGDFKRSFFLKNISSP
jgi:hypothetical protein